MLYSSYKYVTLGLFHTDIYYRIMYPFEYMWQNSQLAIYRKLLVLLLQATMTLSLSGGDMFFHGFLYTVNGDNIKSST